MTRKEALEKFVDARQDALAACLGMTQALEHLIDDADSSEEAVAWGVEDGVVWSIRQLLDGLTRCGEELAQLNADEDAEDDEPPAFEIRHVPEDDDSDDGDEF